VRGLGGEEGASRNPKTRVTGTETLQINSMSRLSKDLNCHGCGSLNHQKESCPRVDWGIVKPAVKKKKAPAPVLRNFAQLPHLSPFESRILEQLALHQLKQQCQLLEMPEQPDDKRLLETIWIAMVKWNAVAVPAIVDRALHELSIEERRVRGGEEEVSVVACDSSAPEVICISSDDDS